MESPFKRLANGVVIIAEIGCNHNGDINIAKRLIEVAAASGANCAKFQSFDPDEMMIVNAPKASYQIEATGICESQYQRLKRISFGPKEHEELMIFCELKGIQFCSSPFDRKSADLLYRLKVPFYKIPSGEITNLPLLAHVASFAKPMIVSTGMSDLGEIEDALNAIGDARRDNVFLMHCVSSYPTKWEDVNLRGIQTLQRAFHLPVGFSDHTQGIELALVAVGLGAVIIEKHITLDRNMEGGDHKASLEPDEFENLVSKIRRVESALGNGVKRCMPCEENTREVSRKSIVAKTFLPKGQFLEASVLALKRPGTGISPKYLPRIIGRLTRVDIEKDQLIEWEQLR